jgi:hypothetical protein
MVEEEEEEEIEWELRVKREKWICYVICWMCLCFVWMKKWMRTSSYQFNCVILTFGVTRRALFSHYLAPSLLCKLHYYFIMYM